MFKKMRFVFNVFIIIYYKIFSPYFIKKYFFYKTEIVYKTFWNYSNI